jgi:hypothetical protein
MSPNRQNRRFSTYGRSELGTDKVYFLLHNSCIYSYPRIRPVPRSLITFRNKLIFYGELLAPHPTPKLEDQLINSIWNKEELPDKWKESTIVPIHRKDDKNECSNYRRVSLLPTSYKILSNILLLRLSPYIDEFIRDHQFGFDVADQLLIRFFHSSDIGEKMEYNERVHQLFVDFKKTYASVRREV